MTWKLGKLKENGWTSKGISLGYHVSYTAILLVASDSPWSTWHPAFSMHKLARLTTESVVLSCPQDYSLCEQRHPWSPQDFTSCQRHLIISQLFHLFSDEKVKRSEVMWMEGQSCIPHNQSNDVVSSDSSFLLIADWAASTCLTCHGKDLLPT